LNIRIYYDKTNFRIKGWKKVVGVLYKVIGKEGKISGDLSYIITNDDELRRINVQFLEHDYDTDVITFNYNDEIIINGEIYISIDRVKENAINYNVSLSNEVRRVILHGLLHLIGYDDTTKEERVAIRARENFWLDSFED